MNLEIAIKETDNVVKLKITSPDKPLVIELTTNDLGTPVTVATEQNESVSPATEAATTDETLKAEAKALSAKLAAMNREYERVKKAAYRAGIRLKENLKALGQTAAMSASGSPGLALAGVPCSVPRVPEACPQDMASYVSSRQSRSCTGRCPLYWSPCPGGLSPGHGDCPRGHLGTVGRGYYLY